MARARADRDTEVVLRATAAFRRHGGLLRMADAVRSGIHRRTLYAMRDAGQVEVLARGLYRLADAPPLGNPDLVTVVAKIPHGVVYLISALAFHDMTTQIPHEVCIAVPRNSRSSSPRTSRIAELVSSRDFGFFVSASSAAMCCV